MLSDEKFDGTKTIDAIWCIDSETGDEVLIDVYSNKILARRVNGEIK